MVFEHFLSRLGIDEGTALIVRQSEARVVGKGRVFFYDREADPEGLLKPVASSAGGRYDLARSLLCRFVTK